MVCVRLIFSINVRIIRKKLQIFSKFFNKILKNLSFLYLKRYLKWLFSLKIQFLVRKKKLASPYIYWAYEHYLPQHCLYLRPDLHGEPLKQPCNFLFENWHFLFENFNTLFLNCNKVMSNSLTMQFKLI